MFKIYDGTNIANEAACSRYIMNRNRQRTVCVQDMMEPESPIAKGGGGGGVFRTYDGTKIAKGVFTI